MDEEQELVAALSRERLDGFRGAATDTDRLLIGRYLYNVAVSEALYPLFHALEVVLRNRLHAAASEHYPVDADRTDTYHRFPCWLDAVHSPLLAPHRRIVVAARTDVHRDLQRRYGATAVRQQCTPGRLIARLSFGFWVFLFDPNYSGSRAAPGVLWPGLLGHVFPEGGGHIHIGTVRSRLRRLHVLRNRLMHHERIVPYVDRDGVVNPMAVRHDIMELLSWMAPRSVSVLGRYDRMAAVSRPAVQRLLGGGAWRHG